MWDRVTRSCLDFGMGPEGLQRWSKRSLQGHIPVPGVRPILIHVWTASTFRLVDCGLFLSSVNPFLLTVRT